MIGLDYFHNARYLVEVDCETVARFNSLAKAKAAVRTLKSWTIYDTKNMCSVSSNDTAKRFDPFVQSPSAFPHTAKCFRLYKRFKRSSVS
jgi:hypothetical protein